MRAVRYALSLPSAALAWLLFVVILTTEFVHGVVVDVTLAIRGRRA